MSDSWTKYYVVVRTTHEVELPPDKKTARLLIEKCNYLVLNLVPAESVEILEMEEVG